MNIWFKEVIEGHVAIEQWLGEGKGEKEALSVRSELSPRHLLKGMPDFAALRAIAYLISPESSSRFYTNE